MDVGRSVVSWEAVGKENVRRSPLSRRWPSEGHRDRVLPGLRIQRCRVSHRLRALPRTLGRGEEIKQRFLNLLVKRFKDLIIKITISGTKMQIPESWRTKLKHVIV